MQTMAHKSIYLLLSSLNIITSIGKDIICSQQFCDVTICTGNHPSCQNNTYICTSSVSICSITCNDCTNISIISSASITNLVCLESNSCNGISIDIIKNRSSFDLICSNPSSCTNIDISCVNPELCQCKDNDQAQCLSIEIDTLSFPSTTSNTHTKPSNSELQRVNIDDPTQTEDNTDDSQFHLLVDTAVVFLVACVTLFWMLVCIGIPLFVKWYRYNYILCDRDSHSLHINISKNKLRNKKGNHRIPTLDRNEIEISPEKLHPHEQQQRNCNPSWSDDGLEMEELKHEPDNDDDVANLEDAQDETCKNEHGHEHDSENGKEEEDEYEDEDVPFEDECDHEEIGLEYLVMMIKAASLGQSD